jgi:hypothetical protein
MQITKHHRYEQFANQTLKWFDTDKHEFWLENMQNPEKRKQLEQLGFGHPDAIDYKINAHGFRSVEFDHTPGFIALGCSFTCGIGLPLQQTWPDMIARATGLNAWNLGIGGCGLDTCFRLLYNYIDVLNPKFVMLLTPESTRFELHCKDTPIGIMHGFKAKAEMIAPALLEQIKQIWYTDDQNSTVNYLKNLLAITQLCSDRQIPLITQKVKTLYQNKLATQWPSARDLQHVGHAEQRACADQFLKELNQN